ncbi:NADH pyrophosphatase [Streptomyces hirsutus]
MATGPSGGLPSGFAHKDEDFRQTVVREVKEETGLDVEAGRLVMLNSGFRTRLEVAYEARLLGGELRLDPVEILEARWCRPDDLPEDSQPVCGPQIRGGRYRAVLPAGPGLGPVRHPGRRAARVLPDPPTASAAGRGR